MPLKGNMTCINTRISSNLIVRPGCLYVNLTLTASKQILFGPKINIDMTFNISLLYMLFYYNYYSIFSTFYQFETV